MKNLTVQKKHDPDQKQIVFEAGVKTHWLLRIARVIYCTMEMVSALRFETAKTWVTNFEMLAPQWWQE